MAVFVFRCSSGHVEARKGLVKRNSIMRILELAEQSAVQMIGSQMLVREMADT